ncbi:hypothetical protein [Streptomyces sp. NBC_01353]|uniref:hypothetical protein n=1 Tax=Streptomyces sp. NBC_01353 TaxID=2903835 RepID=UPI002E33F46F|nr:hypothetical protein [Streptomyces sp. NBC_01353]
MKYVTPLRRTLTALTTTTLLAGGLLLGQTVIAEPAHAAGKKIVCNVPKMRQQAADLRSKAAQLQRLGATAEARKARAQADALDRRAQSCIDAENNNPKPWN